MLITKTDLYYGMQLFGSLQWLLSKQSDTNTFILFEDFSQDRKKFSEVKSNKNYTEKNELTIREVFLMKNFQSYIFEKKLVIETSLSKVTADCSSQEERYTVFRLNCRLAQIYCSLIIKKKILRTFKIK